MLKRFKCFITFLFLVFSTFSHAFILIPTSREFLQPVLDNSGVRFGLNPAFFFSNYQDDIVSPRNSTGYVLVNPAEKIFYLHDILPPLSEVKIDYKASNFGLYVNFEHKYSIESALIKLEKLTNIPLNLAEYLTVDFPRAYDTTTPHEAFVYCFSDDIFLAIGRFKIKWGDARYPVHISDTTFQDNFTFISDVNDFRFTFHYISIIPWLTYEELYIQSNYSRGSDTRKIYSEPYKTIVAHRLDWFAESPVFSGRIGISETNLIGGKKPDLIDISPVMFLHNTWGGNYSNVTGGVDFSLVLGRQLKLYGEWSEAME
uniref:Uncharacterized protein n=1 Tax=Fervidobacterium pennivorans TaxID=93466 RepID=A0A7C4W3T0_FERPE